MPSPTALTIYLFGIASIIDGTFNLLFPWDALPNLGLPIPDARPATDSMALASIAMGIFYTLAAAQRNQVFFKIAVPLQLFTAYVFWTHGGPWQATSIWEGMGGILTGVVLALEGGWGDIGLALGIGNHDDDMEKGKEG